MDLSIFLAKLFGIYFVVFSIAMFTRKAHIQEMYNDMVDNRAVLELGMIFVLLMGILLVLSHNVWVWAWPVFITLIAWLVLIKGVLGLFFPNLLVAAGKAMQGRAVYHLSGGLTFVLGLFLICRGFF